jgi:spore coat protein U-like protein
MKIITSFRKLNLVASIGATLVAVGVASTSSAVGTDTANLSVGATVVSNCTISTTAVAFGNYDYVVVNASTDVVATGTVKTTCTLDSSPTITLGDGANFDNTDGRRMKRTSGADSYLAYDLYTTVAYSTRWGGTGVATPTPTGGEVSNTVFAKLPAGQNKGVGVYADTVVATVTF